MWSVEDLAHVLGWMPVALILAGYFLVEEIRTRREMRRRVDAMFAWWHPGLKIRDDITIEKASIQHLGRQDAEMQPLARLETPQRPAGTDTQ